MQQKTYLRFDLFFFHTVIIQPSYIQLTVKMSNITNNGIFQHLLKHFSVNNWFASSGSYKNSGLLYALIHSCDFKACKNNVIFSTSKDCQLCKCNILKDKTFEKKKLYVQQKSVKHTAQCWIKKALKFLGVFKYLMFIRPCFENNLSVTLMENETCCSSFFLAVQSITLWNHFYLWRSLFVGSQRFFGWGT